MSGSTRHESDDVPRGKVAMLYRKLGNLPQWKVGKSRLSGEALNNTILWVANAAFIMFECDQGVLSALLTLDDFQRSIPLMTPLEESNSLCWTEVGPPNRDYSQCTGSPNTQAAAVAVYQIGCFLGALLILFYGERWGRRPSVFWGSAIMILGTIMQAASFEYGLFVSGRIVGGIGNGMVTSTIPTYQTGCARLHKRGFLIMVAGALIAGGIMIAYWIDYGFYFLEGTVRWRFPIAFQSFFTIIVMIGLLFLPDSPRWLAMRGRQEEARDVTARLLGLPLDHAEVEEELNQINEALRVQNSAGGFRFRELLTNGSSQNFRRTFLGIAGQVMQQFSGINLITYYATFLSEQSLGFGPDLSRLLAAANGTEYFLASLIALPLIERAGRRKLMIFGAIGMSASMAILAGTTSTGVTDESGAPQLSVTLGATAVVFLFVFNTFFAIGWLGTTWLYPAEVTNLRIRIQANSLSTCSNWLSNFAIVMLTPPSFANLQWRTYIIFAVLNAAIVPCMYFFFPETKGRGLEELDLVFAKAHAEKVSPVAVARNMPKTSGTELDRQPTRYFGQQKDIEQKEDSLSD